MESWSRLASHRSKLSMTEGFPKISWHTYASCLWIFEYTTRLLVTFSVVRVSEGRAHALGLLPLRPLVSSDSSDSSFEAATVGPSGQCCAFRVISSVRRNLLGDSRLFRCVRTLLHNVRSFAHPQAAYGSGYRMSWKHR
jgi:hypothetical protein